MPWGDATLCIGCYKGSDGNTVQLPANAIALIKHQAPALPLHEESRSVRLADLAQHFFAGRLDMARGYREASSQVADPTAYALAMSPFYALLDK